MDTLPEPFFMRGDVNDDGQVDIADAVAALDFLFGAGDTLGCLDATDANDDEQVDVADAIRILGYLFGGDPPMTAPYEQCGPDPTDGPLACEGHASCYVR